MIFIDGVPNVQDDYGDFDCDELRFGTELPLEHVIVERDDDVVVDVEMNGVMKIHQGDDEFAELVVVDADEESAGDDDVDVAAAVVVVAAVAVVVGAVVGETVQLEVVEAVTDAEKLAVEIVVVDWVVEDVNCSQR